MVICEYVLQHIWNNAEYHLNVGRKSYFLESTQNCTWTLIEKKPWINCKREVKEWVAGSRYRALPRPGLTVRKSIDYDHLIFSTVSIYCMCYKSLLPLSDICIEYVWIVDEPNEMLYIGWFAFLLTSIEY